MVSVSPGGFVPRVGGDVGDAGTGDSRAAGWDREVRPSPFSAFSWSDSVCVANTPGSTSSRFASIVPLTRRFARRVLPRGCIRAINTSPNDPIMDESEPVDESREYGVT